MLGYSPNKHLLGSHISAIAFKVKGSMEIPESSMNSTSFCIGDMCVPSNLSYYLDHDELGAKKTFLPPRDLAEFLSGERAIPLFEGSLERKRNIGWIEYVDTNGVLTSGTFSCGCAHYHDRQVLDTSLRDCLVNTEQKSDSRLTRVDDCGGLSKEQLDTVSDYSTRAHVLAALAQKSNKGCSLEEIQEELRLVASEQGVKHFGITFFKDASGSHQLRFTEKLPLVCSQDQGVQHNAQVEGLTNLFRTNLEFSFSSTSGLGLSASKEAGAAEVDDRGEADNTTSANRQGLSASRAAGAAEVDDRGEADNTTSTNSLGF